MLKKLLIRLLQTSWVSGLLQCFCRSALSRFLLPWYQKHYQIELADFAASLNEFPSLNAFFIRSLRPGVREIAPEADLLCSPVDAHLLVSTVIEPDATFLVKGQKLSLPDLLENEAWAQRFIGGQFMLLYLSPADYHRIHAPCSGELRARKHCGGKSWPVNSWGLALPQKVLCANQRAIFLLDHCACIWVGATNVNSLLVYPQNTWVKGEELGYFQFGSSVILLLEQSYFAPCCLEGTKVKMGEPLARSLTN